MKTWLYSWVAYPLLYSLAVAFGFFDKKTRRTLALRSWKTHLSLRFNAGKPIEFWVHVASQGELEYAMPILKELDRRGSRVLVTYYSVSARTSVEALPSVVPNVSLVVPLPHDGLGLMKEFVRLVKRQGTHSLLLLKYELWPGLLWECNQQGIRVYLVNALRPSWFHRKLLHKLTGIFAGYRSEVEGVSHDHVRVVGDTRVERVLERRSLGLGVEIEAAARLVARENTMVCGSMWKPDTDLLLQGLVRFMGSGGRLPNVIWVPHELDRDESLRVSTRFSVIGYEVLEWDRLVARAAGTGLSPKPIAIIVMKKGILAELYRLGMRAYVGGGFGAGIHSVWEPSVAGALVACGPRNSRSPESTELCHRDLLMQVASPAEFAEWMRISAQGIEERGLQALGTLLAEHTGASRRIIDACVERGVAQERALVVGE